MLFVNHHGASRGAGKPRDPLTEHRFPKEGIVPPLLSLPAGPGRLLGKVPLGGGPAGGSAGDRGTYWTVPLTPAQLRPDSGSKSLGA